MSRTWFITGTSKGFGREWAEAALERGDRVAATARDVDRIKPLVDAYGDAVLTLELDVTDREAVFEAVGQAVARFGGLDVVVNNAGYGHFGMVEELTEAEVRAELETNFFGTLWVTQAVLPVLRARGGGRIIQVTSEGGVRAFPGIGAYHASKWAVEGLSDSLRQEVAGFGVYVICLEPGPYATDFGGGSMGTSPEHPDYAEVRAATAPVWDLGDPKATRGPILELADTDDPPARVFFGNSFEAVAADYEERLATWRKWQPVAVAAFR
ncbi:SDR family NAD(P)-dependent oxidoreductase [Actinophytocola oryzae]|uniref:NADP-dependent 3-hydroxy acid dehydrogenase YdfG n=1 Tax=Actinophytocola oryzae TaxID=502181 RepID=A0A4R7W5P3_9PSEU|nr:SDR family NAD(P)-dependent oxidoreductase [Actinophytocola oryzae]TDV57438.1 NADP-dependent 3-hydroxy acid dehydrogenase YdfG [Actinophytocola oryzae]